MIRDPDLVEFPDPTPEQIELWRVANEENMKRIMAGDYDYPNPRLDAIEARLTRLEQFLVLT